MKSPNRRQWRPFGVIIVNFEHILQFYLVFELLTLDKQMLPVYDPLYHFCLVLI